MLGFFFFWGGWGWGGGVETRMLITKIGQCEFPFHTLLDELVNLVLCVKKLCHQCHFPVVLNLPIYSG